MEVVVWALVGFVVAWPLLSSIGWAATRKTWAYLYDEAPWNWRVLVGPWAYEPWLRRNR